MVYIHTDFTHWSMGWKITFQILTLLVMFSPFTFCDGFFAGFFVQMRNVEWKYWSDMQCWIAALLVGTFFFNDPFFVFQIYTDSENTSVGLLAFYMVVLGGFTSMILCFFLCTSEDISSEGMSQYVEKAERVNERRASEAVRTPAGRGVDLQTLLPSERAERASCSNTRRGNHTL